MTILDGEDATIDLTSASGVTKVMIRAEDTAGSGDLALTGFGAGLTVQIADHDATDDFVGDINLTMTDATGASDSVTLDLANDLSTDDLDITATGIETLTINSAAEVGVHEVDLTGFDATKIVLTGGEATKRLDLDNNTLNKSVTELDASAFLGDLIVDASGTNSVGVAFKMGDLSISAATGDGVTGSASTTSDDSLTGNFAADDTTAEPSVVLTGIETYNLTFGNGVNITTTANDGFADGDNTVETITFSGGDSLASYTSALGSMDGTSLTLYDASAMKGKSVIDVDASLIDGTTFKGSTTVTTDAMTVTAVNGLVAASTGKVKEVSGFDTIHLQTATADSAIDMAGVSDLTTVSVQGARSVTFSNMAAGTNVQLGTSSATAEDDYSGTVTIGLADATGASDALTVKLIATGADDAIDGAISTTGIETVTLDVAAQTATKGDMDLNVSAVAAASMIVKGGTAAEDLDLTNATASLLSGTTTSFDASAFKGTIVASAETNTATTFTVAGTAAATLTGSSGNDTINLGTATAVTHTVDGGTGNDTVNMTISTGTTAMTSMVGVETYNVTIASDAGAVITTAAAGDFFNSAGTTTVTMTGGRSSSTYDSGTDGVDATSGMTLFDASGFKGKINDLLFDADQLAATVTVKGGDSTADLVTTTYGTASTVRTQGIETIGMTFTAAVAVDVGTYTTGLTKVTVASDGNADVASLTNMGAGVTVTLATDTANDGLTITRADASATDNVQNIELLANDAGEDVLFDMANVETLNIKMGTGSGDTDLVLTNFDMDTAGKTNAVVVTGATNLDIDAISADTNSINASAMTAGGVDVGARNTGTALTFTGSDAAADSVIMVHQSDALDGGEKTSIVDVLDVNFTAVLGGISVDLSAADQVVSMDGIANSAVQTGFENVLLDGYTGFGASITGNAEINTITGTVIKDVISAGAGADIINATLGVDVVTLGTGADDVVFSTIDADDHVLIKDFAVGTDDLDINFVLDSDDNTDVAVGGLATGDFLAVTAAAADTIFQVGGVGDGTQVIYEFEAAAEVISDDFVTATTAELKTGIVAALDSTTDNTTNSVGNVIVVLYDNQATANAVVAHINFDATKGTLSTGEMNIMAVLEGVGADNITVGDFI
jgi:hypothetical protein